MVEWAKKVEKSCSDELGGERVIGALFCQPSGNFASAMGMGVGGVVGSIVAEKAHVDSSSDEGIAASIPKKNLVLAVTQSKLMVFGHSAMSGKPKGLEASIPLSQVDGMDLAEGKLAPKLAVRFADGSLKVFEAPKMGKPADFVAAFSSAR